MLVIEKKDVLLEDIIKIFNKEYKVEIVLNPTTREMEQSDNPSEWALETIKAMTIAEDTEFYQDIMKYKLETTVLNYLIEQLQKKENS